MNIVENTESKEFFKFIDNLLKDDLVYFDIETSGLDPHNSKVYSVQLMFDATEDIFIFDMFKFKELEYLATLIEKCKLVGHNIGFDIKMIKRHSGVMLKNVYCTQVNHVLINQGILVSQYPSLEELVLEYCNVELNKEVREKFYNDGELKSLSQELLIYAAEDVKYLKPIYKKQQELLVDTKQLPISAMESKLTPVIAEMELQGIRLDSKAWMEMAERATEHATKMAKEFKETVLDLVMSNKKFDNAFKLLEYLAVTEVKAKRDIKAYSEITEPSFMKEIAMKHFNPGSTAQAFNLINNILGIKIKNTNEKTLNKVYHLNPLIKQLVTFRETAKSSNTYGEEFLTKINQNTGRIHANFNQVGTQTGRLSSSNPNAQNIPADSSYRSCFIPEDGYKFICADYSQQELRVLAAICRDKVLIKAFNEELDVHQNTAAHLFEKPYDEVTKSERSTGKALNFGVVYGISEFGLWKNWGIPLEDGRKYLDDFYKKVYVEYGAFKDKVGELIYKLGYSNTFYGRKRFYKKKTMYKDTNEMYLEKDSIIRKGINHVIQGTSGDITKLAMIDMYYKNPFGDDNFKLLLQVHDEVLVMVKEEYAEEAKKFVADCLLGREEEVLMGVVPAKIDIKIADYWVH